MFSKTFLLLDIFFMVILIICSITDLKKRIVPNTCIILLLVIDIAKIILGCLTGYPWWMYIAGLIYTVPFFIAWSKNQMGAGDVKMIIVICLYLGLFSSVIFFVFTALVLSGYVVYSSFRSNGLNISIPLVPFITLGYLCFEGVEYFLFYIL